MLRSLYDGISGMKANQVKLDVIGNNIANVGTTSFKSARVRFQDMVSQSMSEASASGVNTGGVNPKQVGLGVQVAGIDTMVGQGMMQPTSRNLDVAMDGEGYLIVANGSIQGEIKVNGDDTMDDQALLTPSYTRDGALTLDDSGHLLTSDGYRVMGYSVNTTYDTTTGKATVAFVDEKLARVPDDTLIPLTIPEKIGDQRVRTFSIEKDGTIKAVLESGSVAIVGQIAMATFNNPAGLSKVGKNLLQNTSNSGQAVVRSSIGATEDNSKGYGDMLQGMLEMSNVDLSEQFTDMIVASRAFQAAGKTITTGDEILQEILALKR